MSSCFCFSLHVVFCYLFLTVFEGCYTALDGPLWKFEIPFSGGLQSRVIVGGIVASTARAIIETPLEYAKVSDDPLPIYIKGC